MSWITITNTGKIYSAAPGATSFSLQSLLAGVTIMDQKARCAKYRYKTVVVSRFDPGLTWHDDEGVWSKLGLAGPTDTPVLATTGSGVVSGSAVGFYTAIHKISSNTLQESNPSPATAVVSFSAQQRIWTLPATHAEDARATHFRLYVSMGGSTPAFVQDVTIGTTSVTENVSNTTLAANIAAGLCLPVDEDGNVDDDARGIPPYCLYVETYHDSEWYAGDPDFPERIYPSKLYEPESVNSTDNGPWLRTLDGEAVTGLKRWGDLLLVFGTNCAYEIQGYGPGQYTIRKISNFYGCISHDSLKRVGPNADLWGAGFEGPWWFDGAFHSAIEDLKDFWLLDYEANKANYEACYAEEDRRFGGYKLRIPQTDQTSFYYYGHYEPTIVGAQPWWGFDLRDRNDSAMGILYGDGDQHGRLVTGSCDGYLRYENVMEDDDDDGDTYGKKWDWTTKHYWLNGDQQGDDGHGASIQALDLYAVHESDTLTLSLYCGDDDARSALVPQWTKDREATAVTGKVEKTSHHIEPIENASGKGVSVRGEVTAPIGCEYRGITIRSGSGQQDRPSTV